ncbi:MAG: ABC transporter permease [Trueperaceae bacterium]
MPLPLYLAWAHVRRRVLQSVLTVAGVAVGVAVLITALALTNGFIDELLDSTLQATPHVTLRAWQAKGVTRDDAEVAARIAEHPEVVAVAPFLATEGLIARRADASLGIGGRQGYVQLLGIDPAQQARVLDLPELHASADRLAERGGLIVGASLALSLGVLPGDEVLVQDVDGRRRTFEIADEFRVGNELIDGLVAYASLSELRSYLRAGEVISGYHVRLVDPARAEAVGRELANDTGLRPTSWSTLFGGLVAQLDLQRAVISVVVFLIVLVAAMGIANVLVLTVAEKTREIAVLRAMGASARQVLATFTLEGLMLGGAGTLLGVLLGAIAAAYLHAQPIPLPGDLYFITRLPMRIAAGDLAWVCGLSLVTSAIAGWIPARRAARLDPTQVLR